MTLLIDSEFDCGNIEVRSSGDAHADLAVRPDSNGPWFQWFYFRVRGCAGRSLTLRIVNAGASAYPHGWPGYRACVSEDNAQWRRTDTAYADGVVEIRHQATGDECWFAYFAPYDLDRHERLIRTAAEGGATVGILGRSVDGRAITEVSLGQGSRQVWLIGRQHSGETMASWWMEGAVERLLDGGDAVAARLREIATVHLVPLVNIDGAARGNLRGNAAGTDLNRQWHAPNPDTAPEVAAVLAAMERTGVDFSLDVHGDETLPHVFVDGCDHHRGATPAQIAGVATFKSALVAANAAFQTAVGYPVSYGGDGAPGMSTRALAKRFGAVSLTLEMPFKDSREAPDPVNDWSPAASAALGRDCLAAIVAVLGG
jgi:murein tripeptide amidase MpaA